MRYLKLIEECYKNLPAEIKVAPWKVVNHGLKVLQTDEDLDAYIAAYGEMHIIKCRAALQNFPFDKLDNITYEIYDWGCGQGIATLILLDMLEERKLLRGLKKVYLIEPSSCALKRAKSWIRQSAGPGVEVIAVNKCIPQEAKVVMSEVSCSSNASINLFSNILDIRELSLSWLANKTASLAKVNYMICVGPKYPEYKNTRITDFCGYFNPKEYFSSIDSFPYGYTTRTHHAFGCQTRCFIHKKETSLISNYKECAEEFGDINYCDYTAECLKGIVNEKTIEFYNALRENSGTSYDVLFKPHINCDTVDLLLMGIGKGIVLINVCEDLSKLEEGFNRIEYIKKQLLNEHLKKVRIDSIINTKVYGCIKTALFFPNATNEEITNEINRSNKNYYKYLLRLNPETNVKDEIGKITAGAFRSEYYEELKGLITSHWHSYKDGNFEFQLTSKQKEIVRSTKNRIRIKGVAGCGKTQIVANRAVEQLLRTGDRVLIITFNISLIQYIRMRIAEVPADFLTNMFEITNYHQFFRSMANRYAPAEKLTLESWNDPEFFKPYNSSIKKYKTIIIDEVQDFKTVWLTSIINYFITDDGSISLFGDCEQNIYSRGVETETKMPRVPTFNGPWNEMKDRISMRTLNPHIADLSSKFAKKFLSEDLKAINIVQKEIEYEHYYVKYWWRDKDIKSDDLIKDILCIIENYQLKEKDTVILGQSINLLRNIECSYREQTQLKTMITFETNKEYNQVSTRSSTHFRENLENIRRVAKTHFTTDCDELKFSTIQSFKGWESTNIILLLQPTGIRDYNIQERENTPALIYTALTRARCNLFIVNMRNTIYNSFFQENIPNTIRQ